MIVQNDFGIPTVYRKEARQPNRRALPSRVRVCMCAANSVGHGRHGTHELHRLQLLPRGPRRLALLQQQQQGDLHHPLPIHSRHRHER